MNSNFRKRRRCRARPAQVAAALAALADETRHASLVNTVRFLRPA